MQILCLRFPKERTSPLVYVAEWSVFMLSPESANIESDQVKIDLPPRQCSFWLVWFPLIVQNLHRSLVGLIRLCLGLNICLWSCLSCVSMCCPVMDDRTVLSGWMEWSQVRAGLKMFRGWTMTINYFQLIVNLADLNLEVGLAENKLCTHANANYPNGLSSTNTSLSGYVESAATVLEGGCPSNWMTSLALAGFTNSWS